MSALAGRLCRHRDGQVVDPVIVVILVLCWIEDHRELRLQTCRIAFDHLVGADESVELRDRHRSPVVDAEVIEFHQLELRLSHVAHHVDLRQVAQCIIVELEVIARTEGGVIMGVQHVELPIHGVQFHPESILTEGGHRMLANWLGYCGAAPAEALVHQLEDEVANAVQAATRRTPA